MENIYPITNHPEYPKAIPLQKAIQKLQVAEEGTVPILESDDSFVKEIKKDKEISSIKVTKLIGKGSSSIAFETESGDIIKLTRGNHFPFNRPHEEFDVPVLKSGKIGKIRYYIEEKLYQHGLSDGFVAIVKAKIKEKGYKTYDFYDSDIHQIGISKDGKLYLLDPECARYKTIFHAIYSKAIKTISKIL